MSLLVQIAAEFVGKKQFREAENAVQKLQSSVKKLAGAAGIGLSTAAFVNFGKKASAAFIADEKAASRLALAVKNLGLEFESPRIERYISELSALSGVADDQLRPSMQKLLQTTGSVAKAQELLTQATDIAAGSGVDYETVVNDLSLAYVGQTRGLRKYSLGVSQAELKTMKFADVQERLNKQFSGASAEFLTTYAGKLQLITTAAGEASEKIGGALVESLVSVFAAGDTTKFVNQIDTLATKIADTVSAVVFGFQKLYVLTSDRAILASFNPFDDYEKNALAAIEAAEKAAKLRRNAPSMGYQGSQPIGIYETSAQLAARKAAESAAAKRARELAALQKKTLDTNKKSLALQKASKTLNLEAIGIEAALKGQISETDRLSLLLQKSILEGNANLATSLSDQLDAAVKRQNELRQSLMTTPEAPNPYRNWTLPTELLNYTASSLGVSVAQLQAAPVAPSSTFSDAQMELMAAVNSFQGANQAAVNVEVYLDGEIVGSAVRDSTINQSLSGSFSQVNRGGRFATRPDEG
jgi:hypothetical protein